MGKYSCNNCVYVFIDPEEWLHDFWMGIWPQPQCANHPCFPGRMQYVSGLPCRNYRPKPATPQGDVRLIPLSDGCYAYVDAADYVELGRHKWHLENGYAARKEKGKTILMHRQIMPPPEGMVVDHIDGSQANNCRFNLRVCTRAENIRNKRKHAGSISTYKGVFYNKGRRKWFSQCWFEGKCRATRYVDDEVEAARAYDRQAVEYFGEFARLNFPQDQRRGRTKRHSGHLPRRSFLFVLKSSSSYDGVRHGDHKRTSIRDRGQGPPGAGGRVWRPPARRVSLRLQRPGSVDTR